jgi:hypothetical protein
MADRNIAHAEKTLQEMQETLRMMRESLKAPILYTPDSNFVPLK